MKQLKNKVLIILKKKEDYESEKENNIGLSTGLYNSALFIHNMLNNYDVKSKMVIVNDNNDIDKEVYKYKPTHVIIEALWVVPEKFNILCKLHPDVKWIIRLHSQLPFISNEGIAMDWIANYVKFPQIIIAANSNRMLEEMRFYLQTKMNWSDEETKDKIIFLPNYFPNINIDHEQNYDKNIINIGCFGSIRPLKNQLIQAMSAIKFAEENNKTLYFHINVGRIEQKGEPILKNLKGLFEQLENKNYKLVLHEWMPRKEFLDLCKTMDIGMQCSFSETFNIVLADLVSVGTPVIGTSEIPWLSKLFTVNPTNSRQIERKIRLAYNYPKLNVWLNKRNLNFYSNKTIYIWLDFLNKNNKT